MTTNNFDPLAYIESAFLDRNPKPATAVEETKEFKLGYDIHENLKLKRGRPRKTGTESAGRFRKTEMKAPRPRRKSLPAVYQATNIDPELQKIWEAIPRNIDFLCSFYNDDVTANYYRGEFSETREELIRRLLDPELSLEEVSRLLGVCPATVRRYTNRGWLTHHRTQGGQRRFRLSYLVAFVEEHGRFPQE